MENDWITQIRKIRTYERGYWAFQVIQTGLRFGLLQTLSEAGKGTPEELAVKLMLYAPFVRIWCRTAYHFEILEGDDSGFFGLPPYLDQALGLDAWPVPFRRGKNGGLLNGYSFVQGNDPFGLFVRTGKRVCFHPFSETTPGRFPATRNLIAVFESMLFPYEHRLKGRLVQGCRLLEIGCGRGDLLLALAGRYPTCRFVGVDPNGSAVGEAEEAAEALGLTDRVSFLSLGGEDMEFLEDFDLILMVLTLHEILPEVRPRLLAQAYKALNQQGELWILDYPYPGRLKDFRNPRFEYGIIEQYFEAPFGIVHLNAEEQEGLLQETGFRAITRRPLGEGDKLDFLTARKGSGCLENIPDL